MVHTGQHCDAHTPANFFTQLDIPEPDVNLEVGDVASTMACAITAQKLSIPVAHVEAGGIRSCDWSMPEEAKRTVTGSISNWFFTTSEAASNTLRSADVADERICLVGSTMVDTLLANLPGPPGGCRWSSRFSRARPRLCMAGKSIVGHLEMVLGWGRWGWPFKFLPDESWLVLMYPFGGGFGMLLPGQETGSCQRAQESYDGHLGMEHPMNTSLKQVEEQALNLNTEERARLAEVMLESLSTPLAEIQEAWGHEIEQRVAAYDRGDISTYSADQVFAEAKRIHK